MVCEWKRCRKRVGLKFNGFSLCDDHWDLMKHWIARLELAGSTITLRQVAMLLEHSTKKKRGKAEAGSAKGD